MEIYKILSFGGLLSHIIGAGLLFYFRLPSNVNRDGDVYLTKDIPEEERRERNEEYMLCRDGSICALFWIGQGFVLQIIANFII